MSDIKVKNNVLETRGHVALLPDRSKRYAQKTVMKHGKMKLYEGGERCKLQQDGQIK